VRLSLAARIAVLVSVLTMVAVAVAAIAVAVTSQHAVDSAVQRHEKDINAAIVKDLNDAGSNAESWSDTTSRAAALAQTYDVRIVITRPDGIVYVDTGSGSLPPLVGNLDPHPSHAVVHIGSTLAATTPWPVWLTIAVIIVLISGLLALPLARSLTKPLERVRDTVKAIHDGDLRARAEVDSPPEIAALATGVNAMAHELQSGELRRRQLSADIAHELRSPLTNIRNHLDAFSDGLLDLTIQNLSSLDSETERLSTLVNDLAVVASLDEGTLRIHPRPTDLVPLIDSALDARRVRAASAGIALSRLGDCDEIHIDPDRTTQILSNLMDNAVRYTPSGGTVEVSIQQRGPAVLVRVSDSGPGIAADDLPYVFDRLWRGDAARGHDGNHGLGLAIARGLAIAQGGSLDVVNLPQGGCEFTLTLPGDGSA